MPHEISLDVAVEMTRRYRELRNTVLNPIYVGKDIIANCETFDRSAFDRLLKQEDCQKIRVYYGMKDDLSVHAIFVGVNSSDKDILPTEGAEGLIMEDGTRCPHTCPPDSPLNV